MFPQPVSYGLMCFDIPATQVNDIVTWILNADKVYLQQEIERRGFATVIDLNGQPGFVRITEVPPVMGKSTPYYGTIGGAYRFLFTVDNGLPLLRIEHHLGKSMELQPYEALLEQKIRFETHASPSMHWYSNRLEYLMQNRNAGYSMFIDGEIYENMAAVGWEKESAHEYMYQFTPTTVGCLIRIHHLPTSQLHDLTADIDW